MMKNRTTTLALTTIFAALFALLFTGCSLLTSDDSGNDTTGLAAILLSAGTTAASTSGDGGGTGTTTITCPTGYVRVPANSTTSTTSDFCVSKYEMKCAADATGAACTGTALAQAASKPWVNIDQAAAVAACSALGTGYHLVTNEEWMTIARDIESTASNWSTGTAGSGMVFRGHTDSAEDGVDCVAAPTITCPASNDDTNGYFGTGNNLGQGFGSGAEQRRTHTLSSGGVVWDLSGNVWEWINWTVTTDKANAGGGTVEVGTAVPTTSMPATSFQPSNTSLTAATNGIGQYFPGTNGAGGAAQRGGTYNPPTNAQGIYTLDLTQGAGASGTQLGFRCAYTPQ